MPDALIVYEDSPRYDKEGWFLIEKMVRIGLIKRVLVKGVQVYGRHYLTARAIREAYKKNISYYEAR